jgi:hypothetical protein
MSTRDEKDLRFLGFDIPNRNYSSTVNEIFFNDFDYTWHMQYKLSNSDIREWTIMPNESAADDGSVVYKYNNDFFRCDDFTSSHDGKHILFAGCSETEGMGGNVEDVWGHILHEKIARITNVDGYYSIGKAGYGWQKIILSIQVYIKKYGKPDMIFALLPNIGRLFAWSENINDWHYQQKYPGLKGNEEFVKNKKKSSLDDREGSDEFAPQAMLPNEYRKVFIDFAAGWKLFEDYCKQTDIKLLWGTWEDVDDFNFTNTNIFSNFVPLSKKEFLDNADLSEKYNQGSYRKRDGHHGRLFHEFWANKFLETANEKGFFND